MENKLGFHPDPKLKLMEQVREVLAIIIMPPHRADLLPMYNGPHALMANSLRPGPAINKKPRPRGEERGLVDNSAGHGCLSS